MIYILCVIHTSYWLNLCDEPLKSAILFEMPLIFFISGAAMGLSPSKKSFATLFNNRFKRVMLPYYFYIFCCLAFTLLLSLLWDRLPFSSSHPDLYPSPDKISITRILIPTDAALPLPYMWHLWFILPYLIISCSFTVQYKLAERISRWPYMILLSAICIAAVTTDEPLLRNIAIYNFFFMSGVLFYKKLSIRAILIILLSSITLLAFACLCGISFTPMQIHKFPPDLFFLTAGIAAICLFAIPLTYMTLPSNSIISRWNTHGYTIYLWQNFFFILALLLLPEKIFITGNFSSLGKLLYPIAIFVIATLASFIIPVTETKALGIFRISLFKHR